MHDKTNKMTCVPSEDSNQPVHLPRLTRVSLCAQWVAKDPTFLHADSEDAAQPGHTLIRLGRCPGWYESSLGALVILLVISCGGSFSIVNAFKYGNDSGDNPWVKIHLVGRRIRRGMVCTTPSQSMLILPNTRENLLIPIYFDLEALLGYFHNS